MSPSTIPVPEALKPGTKLVIEVSSPVEVVLSVLGQGAEDERPSVVASPPESSNMKFEYVVGSEGFYQLRLSQHRRYPFVDASVRMTIVLPKAKEDGLTANS
jgi:hypothetical protein